MSSSFHPPTPSVPLFCCCQSRSSGACWRVCVTLPLYSTQNRDHNFSDPCIFVKRNSGMFTFLWLMYNNPVRFFQQILIAPCVCRPRFRPFRLYCWSMVHKRKNRIYIFDSLFLKQIQFGPRFHPSSQNSEVGPGANKEKQSEVMLMFTMNSHLGVWTPLQILWCVSVFP